jgi:carbon-monoxide dehydrogenase small subunit
MSGPHTIRLTVNGVERTGTAPSRRLLSDFIREDLQLTGTHVGCEQGVCGSCTVVLDGRQVRSCLLFAVQADGRRLETIESLASGADDLHAVQRAFWEKHGLQCGFCTPAMVLTTKLLLEQNPDPSDDEIRLALTGTVCRCTGYVNIVESVKEAARLLREEAVDG